jgi:hypothetical protein
MFERRLNRADMLVCPQKAIRPSSKRIRRIREADAGIPNCGGNDPSADP